MKEEMKKKKKNVCEIERRTSIKEEECERKKLIEKLKNNGAKIMVQK